jgi:Ca2+-binding RTX toxin-like protein
MTQATVYAAAKGRAKGLWGVNVARKASFVFLSSVVLVASAASAEGEVTPLPPGSAAYYSCPEQIDGAALGGDDADDVLVGTPQSDLLVGGGGNDTISGLAEGD